MNYYDNSNRRQQINDSPKSPDLNYININLVANP